MPKNSIKTEISKEQSNLSNNPFETFKNFDFSETDKKEWKIKTNRKFNNKKHLLCSFKFQTKLLLIIFSKKLGSKFKIHIKQNL